MISTGLVPAVAPLLAIACALPCFGQAADSVVAIEHVSVIPMTDRSVLDDHTIIVRGGTIAEIGRASAVKVPARATRIDGRGRYVFPGLTDTHVHLEGNPSNWLGWFLSHGVTTVWNLRGGPEHLELRRKVLAGEVVGPTIYTSGPFTNQPAVHSAADAERAVEEQKAAGYDFVKIHGNLTAEAYAALLAAGRSRQLAITGHAPRNLPFDSVITGRQPLVAHAEELIYTRFRTLDTAGLGQIAAQTASAGGWITPTLTTFSGIVRQWGRPGSVDSVLALDEWSRLPATLKQYWRGSNPYTGRAASEWAPKALEFHVPMIRALSLAGVPLLTGTDTPLPIMLPGHSLHDEIRELERVGVDRFGVLRAATANAGRFMAQFVDPSIRFGTVTVGSRADLVLTDRNPFDDPTALIHPAAVMTRGRWYDRSALDRMVDESSKAPAEKPVEATVSLSQAELDAFAGKFRSDRPQRDATISAKDGKLTLTTTGQPPFELIPIGRRKFAAQGSMTKLELEFSEDRNNVVITANGSPVASLTRVP